MPDMLKEYFNSTAKRPQSDPEVHNNSSGVLVQTGVEDIQNQLSEPSAYTLASDQSQMSRDVDLWLHSTTASTGIQLSRTPPTQGSTSENIPSGMTANGMWYLIALLLPFLSINNYPHWSCSPSAILNSVEMLVSSLGRACDELRSNIRRLAQNQLSREFIATAMDVILVIYAMGFLVLSMYQTSIIR